MTLPENPKKNRSNSTITKDKSSSIPCNSEVIWFLVKAYAYPIEKTHCDTFLTSGTVEVLNINKKTIISLDVISLSIILPILENADYNWDFMDGQTSDTGFKNCSLKIRF